MLRAAVRLCEENQGEQDTRTLATRSMLGACLARLGRAKEAEPHLVEAVDRMVPFPGQHHLKIEAVVRLVAFFESEGRSKEAAERRAQLDPEARAKLGWDVD